MGTKMFELYPQPADYIPKNRPKKIKSDDITIMTGETTTHSFEVPMDVRTETSYFKALYKLGLEVILEKPMEDCDVVYDEDHLTSILTWKLSPSETMLFSDTWLDTKVQIEFTLKDGSIIFSDIMKIKVENSLRNAVAPAPVTTVAGFGWTED